MKRSTVYSLLLVMAMMFFGSAAGATLYKFNDIPTPLTDSSGVLYGPMPAGYAGFNWTGWVAIDNATYDAAWGDTLKFGSPPVALYNDNGGVATIEAGPGMTSFDYNGSFFAAWLWGDSSLSFSAYNLTITAYLAGQVKGTATIDLVSDPADFWWNKINFYGIDKLVFTPTALDPEAYFIMDCAQLTPHMASVPLPPSLYLLGAGLVGALGWRRKVGRR
jgi:hypothetical protein